MSEIQNLQTYGMIQKSCRLNFYCFINPFFFGQQTLSLIPVKKKQDNPKGIFVSFFMSENKRSSFTDDRSKYINSSILELL